jgi:hypothetical protein
VADNDAAQVEAAMLRLLQGLEERVKRLVDERLATVGRQVDTRLKEVECRLGKIKVAIDAALAETVIYDDDDDDDDDEDDWRPWRPPHEPKAEGA